MWRILIPILLMLATAARANEPIKPGPQPRTFRSAIDATEQPYNLFIPTAASKGAPVPLVVALHGHGATWESWFQATKVCEWAEQEGYAVLCPQGRGNLFYLGNGEKDVYEAIADAQQLLAINPERIYLIGHSMGGWGTWQLACARPDFWAAIAPMSSWAPVDMLPNIEYLDPFIVHGVADAAVEVRRSRTAAVRLSQLGISHRYLELPGVGHESSAISKVLPQIGDHLRGKTRMTVPIAINHGTYTYGRGKAWWLQIRNIETPGKQARVRAAIEKGTLVINPYGTKEFAIDLGATTLSVFSFPIPVSLDGQELLRIPNNDIREGRSLVIRWTELLPPENVERKGWSETIQKPKWEAEIVDTASLPPVVSPVIGKVTTPRAEIPALIGKLLAEDYSVSAAVMSDSLLLPDIPQGDITFDALFDFLMRLEEDGPDASGPAYYNVTAADITAMLEKQDEFKPSWWSKLVLCPELDLSDPAKKYMIISPGRMRSFLGKGLPSGSGNVQTSWRDTDLRRVIINHVKATGNL